MSNNARTEDPLLVDLYQLTMLQAYFDAGMEGTAVFEFFIRRLPPGRNFLMAAGLEQALQYLETLHFEASDLERIAGIGGFRARFLDWLSHLRFMGDVHAMPEGTVFFANEPILRVTAPLPQAQFVETRLINLLHFQTLIASKAARCALTAPEKLLVDFGLRRAHGAEAGLLAARAAYLAGFAGTATVAAGQFAIPLYGTMAHSYVQACGDETAAFVRYARSHPQNCVLLIDTYDTEAAAHKVAALAPKLADEGIAIKAVRIDSGDLAALAVKVRNIFDASGCRDIGIFVSGGLDERRIGDLVARGAPIDGFGVGTDLVTSADAPHLDCAYKLQEYAGRPTRKRSPGKATWPGRKQVFRASHEDATFAGDTLALDTPDAAGERLLIPMMVGGRRGALPPSLDAARAYARSQLERLPPGLRSLDSPSQPYAVTIAQELAALAQSVDRGTYRPGHALRPGASDGSRRLSAHHLGAHDVPYVAGIAAVPEALAGGSCRAPHELEANVMTRDIQPMFVTEWSLDDAAMAEQPRAGAHERIPLPRPRMQGGRRLMDVLKDRSSCRKFLTKPLSPQLLSDLLWSAFGVNRPDTHGRTAPSTENWQEIAVYVANADGLFVYEPTTHALLRLVATDIRTDAGLRSHDADAPLDLIYVADFSRATDASEDERRLYCAANAGFIAENVYLFCASEGLGTVVRGAINRPLLAAIMGLGGRQRIILAQSVGFRRVDGRDPATR